MKRMYGRNVFGYWKELPEETCDGLITDEYEDFTKFKNTIDKESVIKHIESLGAAICSIYTHDIFTGEEFNSGFYEDGEFHFPVDFLRYYKTRDIGIPYEYEEYLKTILK